MHDIIKIREFKSEDLPQMIEIWNEVVEEGIAFPQLEPLDQEKGKAFFQAQSFTGVAVSETNSQILGLYILHPNNEGRCGHICNASYAVKKGLRGKHIGEKLVTHCMETGARMGFRILQFNAVVRTNAGARHLYEKLGFVQLGVIPGGFLMKDGHFEDIIVYYHIL